MYQPRLSKPELTVLYADASLLSATLFAALSIAALITGAVTLALGLTGYGAVVRYLPLQVVADV